MGSPHSQNHVLNLSVIRYTFVYPNYASSDICKVVSLWSRLDRSSRGGCRLDRWTRGCRLWSRLDRSSRGWCRLDRLGRSTRGAFVDQVR